MASLNYGPEMMPQEAGSYSLQPPYITPLSKHSQQVQKGAVPPAHKLTALMVTVMKAQLQLFMKQWLNVRLGWTGCCSRALSW